MNTLLFRAAWAICSWPLFKKEHLSEEQSEQFTIWYKKGKFLCKYGQETLTISHGFLWARLNEGLELILNNFTVSFQVRVTKELFTEEGLPVELSVQAGVLYHGEHDEITDCDSVARDEARSLSLELAL